MRHDTYPTIPLRFGLADLDEPDGPVRAHRRMDGPAQRSGHRQRVALLGKDLL